MDSKPHTTPAATRIRIVLVEDDPVFTEDVLRAAAEAPDMVVTEHAATQSQGFALLDGPAADVLLVDLGLPDGSGIDVIQHARRVWPDCAIMVSTTFGDEAHVLASIEAGAVGYLLKDSNSAELIEEIRTLHAGGSPISPLIARKVLMRFAVAQPPSPTGLTAAAALPESEVTHQLSPREVEVLSHISKGFSFEEVSATMGVSRYTVQSFVRRIYAKLGVNSRAEAIYEARQIGLLR